MPLGRNLEIYTLHFGNSNIPLHTLGETRSSQGMETNKDRAGFSCEFLKFNSYGSESLKAAGRFQRHGKGGGHMHQIERVDWRAFKGVLADFSIYNLCFILIFILKKKHAGRF